MRRRPRRLLLLPLVAVLLLLGIASGERHQHPVQAVPLAQPVLDSGDRTATNSDLMLHSGEVVSHDALVNSGKLEVPTGAEVTHDAVVENGNANIAGKIGHDLKVSNGDVTITGSVGHDVTAMNGSVTLSDSARVGGSLHVTNGELHRGAGAQVGGSVSTGNDTGGGGGFFDALFGLVRNIALGLVFVTVGTLTILVAPRQTSRTVAVLESAPGSAVGVGLVTAVFAPPVIGIVSVVLFITVIGIIVAIPLMLALFLAWVYGLIALGLGVGRRIADSGHLPAARGSLLLTAVTGLTVVALAPLLLAAVVPWIGWPLVYFAGFIGLGAAILDRLGVQGALSWASLTHSPRVTHPLSGPPVVPPSDRRAS